MNTGICVMLIALGIEASSMGAKTGAASETPLTEVGQKLQQRYTGMLAALKTEISEAVSAVAEKRKAAYLNARKAELDAYTKVKAARRRVDQIQTTIASVEHAWERIGDTEKNIAMSQEKLECSTTESEHDLAKRELVKWQENRDAAVKTLESRKAALEKAKREQPTLVQELDAAEK